MQRDRAEMTLVRAGLEDVGDLLDGEPDVVVAREVVRAEADTRIRAEVAQDLACLELGMDGRELRDTENDRPAAASGIARAAYLEPSGVRQVDQELRLAK